MQKRIGFCDKKSLNITDINMKKNKRTALLEGKGGPVLIA